jgi:hypothetical protein
MLCACAAQCIHEFIAIVRVPHQPQFRVSGLLLQME